MKTISILFLCLIATLFCKAADTVWTPAPFVITQPGTYSGLFIKSTSFGTPCIQVNPQGTGKYTITNSVLIGAGDLIDVNGNSRITIIKNKLRNLPSTDATQSGKAIFIYNPYSVDVENNELKSTGGINIQGWKGGATDSLIVRYNKSRNIVGLTSQNKEGKARHFLWLNTCWNIAASDISWNENIDIPDSSVEQDVVNIYNSSGTANSPINIHHNYFQGVYPFPSTLAKTSADGMITDGDNAAGKTKQTTTSFVHAYNNQFVGMGNAGMNIANGHDVRYNNNRIISSGLLPNGNKSTIFWSGVCIWNSSKIADSLFYNNSIDSNYIGYTSWGQNYPYLNRQDENNTATNVMVRGKNMYAPNVPITLADEANEYTIWAVKRYDNNIVLGLDSSAYTHIDGWNDTTSRNDSVVYVFLHDTLYLDTAKPKIIHDTVPVYFVPILQYKQSSTPPQSSKIINKPFMPMKHEEIV